MKSGKTDLKKLFQHEYAKMVAVISKLYGLAYIETAEDIVSETFLAASENWDSKGIPANPTAWLYTVAKNKTLHHFRRQKTFDEKVIPWLENMQPIEDEIMVDFSLRNIKDSQLQMLFAVCNPAIAGEAQIGLALRILCGFGIEEIAAAFLSNKETINKRLFRAKEKLRTEKLSMEFPPENELPRRIDNVLHIIYLLFNEGYYSQTQDRILRKDLCIEAMRLCTMLIEYEKTNFPKTNALLALMCFHSSRFEARNKDGNAFILYDEQEEELWDANLIKEGKHFLNLSMQGKEISSYHLEARIAYWHSIKIDIPEKWEEILQLYNQLLIINYSPAVALNRTYALYKANGWQEALIEAEKLKLENNHFYFLLLGELYKNTDLCKAKIHFLKAYDLAKTQTEKQNILEKIKMLDV